VRLLRFGGFAHGNYYGNKHYLKDIAACRGTVRTPPPC